MSLLTGLHARQHGYVDQSNSHNKAGSGIGGTMVCEGWPVRLSDAGYHVAGVGCIGTIEPWLDEAVLVDPVEKVKSTRCAYMSTVRAKGMEKAIHEQRSQRLRHGLFDPNRLVIDSEDDVDGFIGAKARSMVTAMPKDKPWALIVIFSGPANDLPPPTLFEYIVDPGLLQDGFIPTQLTKVDALAELDYPRVLLQRLEPESIGRIRADYLGRVSLIDYCIGRVVSAARNRNDGDRTWSVISSDRGQLLGEHGLVGHRSFLAGAVEVPVIISPPKPIKQKVYPQLLSTIDVAATIAAICGCDLPKAAVGRSLLPIINSQQLDGQSWPGCISEFGRRLMLETERHKVVFDTEQHDAIGLYDKLVDPDELNNLVGEVAASSVLDSLRCRLSDMLLGVRAMPGNGV